MRLRIECHHLFLHGHGFHAGSPDFSYRFDILDAKFDIHSDYDNAWHADTNSNDHARVQPHDESNANTDSDASFKWEDGVSEQHKRDGRLGA